jgi:hypothetical protein
VTAYNAGGVVRGMSSVGVVSHGRCPLDDYPLIEIDDMTVTVGGELISVEGGWDHLVSLGDYEAGQQRIAEAHGFEASAAAEQIARDA